MAAKKRKRRTKFYVHDTDALASLVAFGINHRAAIADQCFKRFRQINSPGDRLSLAVECFVCMMANIEDLEKAYFAIRRKVKGDRGSFLELFTKTRVKEPATRDPIAPSERSARVALRDLARMSLKDFRLALELPTFEEWRSLGRAPISLGPRELRGRYNAELGGLKKRMRQAFKNRATKRLMNAYNHCKHGFVALHHGNPPPAFLVEKAYGRKLTGCWIKCLPFSATETAVRQCFENTKSVALCMRALLTLWGRIKMSPPPN